MNTPTLINADIVNVEFGKNVKIICPTNIYGCKLCDDVFIGPFCEIQKMLSLGKEQGCNLTVLYVNMWK